MKTLDDYTVVIRPDESVFLAYVPAIPGCHAMGDTSEDARLELALVFDMWRELYQERGELMPDDVGELVAVAS